MDRNEHLQWCRDRAIKHVNAGDINQAFASFSSDMSKHSKTAGHPALELGTMLLFGGHLGTVAEMKQWILGFN